MKPTTLAALLAALPLLSPAQTALTVYNQNFAVVRETVPLDLQAGTNAVAFDRATLQVEPDSQTKTQLPWSQSKSHMPPARQTCALAGMPRATT